ncbi:LysR family transcriptional regulator [Phreatobacter sp. AB_2022a]|uniref:LysR family transcriptional regulator n=1 Tax=Phreatobacter sp. AB_2022a TaxID=3003134 RepID=UPI00228715B4|nr:LysR family transcriptional regulator [Phreatobacter sp. AB_2022a]MCZ0736170.1 LysR family transcriptional regulator [Phreatobacter sp. AB_2022a]
MHSRIDWDDLRYVLAVADNASLAAAARALGVNHTTVLRRVAAFEARLKVRLFDRLPTGYALTAAGEEILAMARELSGQMAALERKILGRDLRLDGSLRVTTTDTLMASLLPPLLARFLRDHPGIVLEVTTTNQLANLTKRDADVAIRPAADPPETLVGRKVADVAFAVYAAPGAAQADGGGRRWVGTDAGLAGTVAARWLAAEVPDGAIALRADTMVGMAEAAAAGIGAAVLPCYLGDRWPGLERHGAVIDNPRSALWVLTHEDLRRTARVSTFTEFMVRELRALRGLLEGGGASD